MNLPLISNPHQSPWLWQLATHEVSTLDAEPQTRWLKVEEGSVWLTRRESGIDRSDDIWLAAGESLVLPACSAWVLEAWPQARVSLLQQAPARPAARRGGAPWLAWFSRLSWLRASAMPAL